MVVHACPSCGARFNKLARLARHELSKHTGERPFVCTSPGCGVSYTRKDHLTRHECTHSGLAKWSCTHCGTAFYEQSHWKRHVATHANRKGRRKSAIAAVAAPPILPTLPLAQVRDNNGSVAQPVCAAAAQPVRAAAVKRRRAAEQPLGSSAALSTEGSVDPASVATAAEVAIDTSSAAAASVVPESMIAADSSVSALSDTSKQKRGRAIGNASNDSSIDTRPRSGLSSARSFAAAAADADSSGAGRLAVSASTFLSSSALSTSGIKIATTTSSAPAVVAPYGNSVMGAGSSSSSRYSSRLVLRRRLKQGGLDDDFELVSGEGAVRIQPLLLIPRSLPASLSSSSSSLASLLLIPRRLPGVSSARNGDDDDGDDGNTSDADGNDDNTYNAGGNGNDDHVGASSSHYKRARKDSVFSEVSAGDGTSDAPFFAAGPNSSTSSASASALHVFPSASSSAAAGVSCLPFANCGGPVDSIMWGNPIRSTGSAPYTLHCSSNGDNTGAGTLTPFLTAHSTTSTMGAAFSSSASAALSSSSSASGSGSSQLLSDLPLLDLAAFPGLQEALSHACPYPACGAAFLRKADWRAHVLKSAVHATDALTCALCGTFFGRRLKAFSAHVHACGSALGVLDESESSAAATAAARGEGGNFNLGLGAGGGAWEDEGEDEEGIGGTIYQQQQQPMPYLHLPQPRRGPDDARLALLQLARG